MKNKTTVKYYCNTLHNCTQALRKKKKTSLAVTYKAKQTLTGNPTPRYLFRKKWELIFTQKPLLECSQKIICIC